MHFACEANDRPLALLLAENGANLSARNNEGKIALELCSGALARDVAVAVGKLM